jgi:hypothetical protein
MRRLTRFIGLPIIGLTMLVLPKIASENAVLVSNEAMTNAAFRDNADGLTYKIDSINGGVNNWVTSASNEGSYAAWTTTNGAVETGQMACEVYNHQWMNCGANLPASSNWINQVNVNNRVNSIWTNVNWNRTAMYQFQLG